MNKNYLLNESKTFCMFPWMHLNVTPKGDIYPCCSNDYTKPFGNTKETTLKEAFNNPGMKQLRLDMMSDVKNPLCANCYKKEDMGFKSMRQNSMIRMPEIAEEAMTLTNDDGSLNDFKLTYLDIRFNNLCNFFVFLF